MPQQKPKSTSDSTSASVSASALTPNPVWVIGTPIGNLEDISTRARQTIESLDILACEDTRRAGRLCELAGISRPPKLVVLNEHTEHSATKKLIDYVQTGSKVGLISDAGMPTLSDPGRHFILACHQADIAVSVIPGPTAFSAALALSGMDANRVVFEGFLPRKGKKRAERFSDLASEVRTTVVYESPHRIHALLEDLCSALDSSRSIFIARELTKMHEQVWRGELGAAKDALGAATPKGEFVVVIAGVKAKD